MYNFHRSYMSIYLVCEDRLIYYHLWRIFLGPYATIANILALGILGKAMIGWIDGIHTSGYYINFFKVGTMPIGYVGEGVNLEV